MGFSNSKNYNELMLFFELEQTEEDFKQGVINIKVFGNILDETKYFYTTYTLSKMEMYENDDYNELINLLKNNQNKQLKVLYKVENNKVTDLKIDLVSLVSLFNDNRLKKLTLLSWNENSPKSYYTLDRKLLLGPDNHSKNICNIIIFILAIILLLFNGLTMIVKPSAFIIVCPLSIITIIFLFYYCNKQIEIDNSIVYKISFFNRKKKIGYLSDITSYSQGCAHTTVLKNNQVFFKFSLSGRNDNQDFLTYLKNTSKISIFTEESKMIGYTYFSLGVLCIFTGGLLIGVPLLFWGIIELSKHFHIIDNVIIYNTLFNNKTLKISDLTKIQYKKHVFNYKGITSVRYTITGFNIFRAERLFCNQR